jgi:hypothetical protein
VRKDDFRSGRRCDRTCEGEARSGYDRNVMIKGLHVKEKCNGASPRPSEFN